MTLYQFLYLAAAFLFIFALKWMSHPSTARRGVFSGELGMLLAVVGTLIRHEVIDYNWIVIGLVVGAAIGIPIAVLMPMTAVPQRTAISLSCGAFASALIGTAEYYKPGAHPAFTNAALMIEILLGFLTTTASLMAFGKLQEILPGRPIVFKFQNFFNLGVLAVAAGIGVVQCDEPGRHQAVSDLYRSGAGLRRIADYSDRRRRYADRDCAAQLLFAGFRPARWGLLSTTSCSSSRARSTDRPVSSFRSSCAGP